MTLMTYFERLSIKALIRFKIYCFVDGCKKLATYSSHILLILRIPYITGKHDQKNRKLKFVTLCIACFLNTNTWTLGYFLDSTVQAFA
ncbi:hypothetical protein X777_00543 [Ooceraea biroi]|uniref:Uncharacterized protein n=1 Tax=Ooceraea biroi TaxID=2015173 RepID=A0A026VTU2_OOCBI|nr:hypothetical protein X777_00543 [Ooceraea biroi]